VPFFATPVQLKWIGRVAKHCIVGYASTRLALTKDGPVPLCLTSLIECIERMAQSVTSRRNHLIAANEASSARRLVKLAMLIIPRFLISRIKHCRSRAAIAFSPSVADRAYQHGWLPFLMARLPGLA